MVSIIIPAFNAGKYLNQAIDSIIAQSYQDWELIIVNNGSTDSTNTIALSYTQKDHRIHLLTIPTSDVSAARNYGIDHALGDYISFLDADDILHPHFLSALLKTIQAQNSKLAAAPFVPFKDKHTIPSLPAISSTVKIPSPILLKGPDAIPSLFYQTPIHGSNKILDTSLWGKIYHKSLWNNTRLKEGTKFEDLEIFHQILNKTDKISFLPIPLIYYRIHRDNFTQQFAPSRLDVLKVCDQIVQFYSRHNNSISTDKYYIAARTRRFAAAFNTILLLFRHQPDSYDAIQRCIRIIKEERKSVLKNRKARTKDRVGAALAYLPTPFLRFAALIF